MVQAEIDFSGGNTANINYPITGTVRVDYNNNGPGTQLTVQSGADISANLEAYNNGEILMTGGRVGWNVNAFGTSRATVSGGTIAQNINAFNSSHAVVTGNTSVGFVCADNTATIDVTGGDTRYYIEAYGNSRICVSGGTFKMLYALENGVITLEGTGFKVGDVSVSGMLDIAQLVQVGALQYYSHGVGGQYNGILSGVLADGQAFRSDIQIDYRMMDGVFANGANYNLVPEPVTLLLLGLGGVALRRRVR
jgi:hypothetical protein